MTGTTIGELQPAALDFSDATRRGQAEPRAAPPRLRRVEGLEDLLDQLRRDTRPVVFHVDREVLSVDARAHEHVPAVGRLQRVQHEIDEDLAQLDLIAEDDGVLRLESQLELESRGIADMAATKDGQEGIGAFVERRKASFTGE